MFNNKFILSLFILNTVFFPWLFNAAVYGSDFHSPRSDALGGASHASPLLGDAIYLNPSFIPFIQTHSLSLTYLSYGFGQTNSPYGLINYYGHNLNVSVMDGSAESIFQAGVGYTVRDDSSMIHVALAKQIFPKVISVGISTKIILPNDNSGSKYVDGTLSASVLAYNWLQVSAIVDNLFNSATPLGFYREYILGTKFNIMGITLIYIDPHMFSDLSLGYEAGIEFPFFSDFFFRLGRMMNSMIPYQGQRGEGYGAGMGWVGPKISLDYSFSRAYTPISALSHNFGVSVFF